MTVTVEQTTQATTGSATSLLLPSWSIVAGEFLAVCVALRDDTVVPTVSGHGLTWVEELAQIGTDGQNACYIFRAQAAVNNTGQITISLPSNGDPVGAAGVRISGQQTGDNGGDAIDDSNTDASPSDNDDFLVDLTSVTDECVMFGWGTFRLATFTAPGGQTILQSVNVGSSGDTTRSALWRLNGLKSPAGAQTLGGTASLDSNRDWCSAGLAIKPLAAVAQGGGAPPSALNLILGI